MTLTYDGVDLPLVFLSDSYKYQWALVDHCINDEDREHNNHDGAEAEAIIAFVFCSVSERLSQKEHNFVTTVTVLELI
jgi:hypothetical protein